MNRYLVFDLGGTFIKYAMINEDTEILKKGKIPTPERNSTKEQVYSVFDAVVEKYREQIKGIAISSPGIIESTEGKIQVIGILPSLNNCHITNELEERYHLPVSIENDAKSAALAELWKGNLEGVKDGAVFIIGTSIGGAIILDGKLRRGMHSSAGEFSGMNMDCKNPKDKDSYIAEIGASLLCQKVQEACHLDHTINGEVAFALINSNDEHALYALKEYTDTVALQLFNINLLLDLECICIGGGISQQPILLEYLRRSISDIAGYHPDILAGTILPLPKVEVCKFHNDANLLGAVYHYIYELDK